MKAGAILALLFLMCIPAKAQPEAIPFRLVNGHVIVRCSTDMGPQDCLVDTGAQTSQVSRSLGRGLTPISQISVRGVTGNSQHATLATGSLTLGSLSVEVPVVVADLGTKEYSVILGANFFMQAGELTIDYADRELILSR